MITIVDYGVGNVASLANMLEYVGTDSRFSCDPKEIERAPKLLLPGVGSFAFAMQILRERQLDIAIQNAVRDGALLLGVCLGMQLLGRFSEEGDAEGLGLLEADVRRIRPSSDKLKIPNMGWQEVTTCKNHWLMLGDSLPERYYFAHSYHMICDDPSDVVATIDYDGTKVVAVAHKNVFGVQFHPEKSHRFGARLLSDFAGLDT
jgi:glutamine amidotransferase